MAWDFHTESFGGGGGEFIFVSIFGDRISFSLPLLNI